MRARTLRALLATAFALFFALQLAGPAGAQEEEESTGGEDVEEVIHHAEEVAEENGATHADVECIPILVEGGTIDECREAPNPLIPEINELIWGAFGFIVVFGFLAAKGVPAIKKTMAERSEKIAADLDAAEKAKVEAQSVVADYESKISEARTEAARIIEEARQSADAMKREQEARLQAELAEMRTRAQADIESQKSAAMASLRGDVTDIALSAAEAVVGRSLDRAAQTQLIEDYINRVGNAGNN